MAAKKSARRRTSKKRSDSGAAAGAVQAIVEAISKHEAAIAQLAEVVVNLHANVRALRDVVEPLSDRTPDPRVAEAGRRLRGVTLDE